MLKFKQEIEPGPDKVSSFSLGVNNGISSASVEEQKDSDILPSVTAPKPNSIWAFTTNSTLRLLFSTSEAPAPLTFGITWDTNTDTYSVDMQKCDHDLGIYIPLASKKPQKSDLARKLKERETLTSDDMKFLCNMQERKSLGGKGDTLAQFKFLGVLKAMGYSIEETGIAAHPNSKQNNEIVHLI